MFFPPQNCVSRFYRVLLHGRDCLSIIVLPMKSFSPIVMRVYKNIVCVLTAVLCCSAGLRAQDSYTTSVHQPDIHTLQVHYQSGEALSRPYLVLDAEGRVDGSDEGNTLSVSFDCMGHDVHYYSYTVYHLNADGRRSDLQSVEYLHGFTTRDITDQELSNNTQQIYTHYRFSFPNEDMQLIGSGNYVVHIYEDNDVRQAVADVCFQVVEPLVGIDAKLKSATTVEFNGRYQQLDMTLNTRHLNWTNPDELTVVVRQNNRTDNQVYAVRPDFIEGSKLRYENNRRLVFEGGNEYRHFDAFSAYYAGTGIDRVVYDHRDYHAMLEPDENRGVTSLTDKTGSPYMFENDVDGQYMVHAERTDNVDTDAEYMWVHWFLPMPEPFLDGAMYVGGDLFLNQMTFLNRMTYDVERKGYYLNALLKQGAYDYQYWFMPKEHRLQTSDVLPSYERGATLLRAEGSHWETKNTYTIYVYYRPFGARADRLVGLQEMK